MKRIIIDLNATPKARWNCLKPYKKEISVLINTYLNDLEDVTFFESVIDFYKSTFINTDYLRELSGIASFTEFSVDNLLIANLYYDALKLVFGCTAFSVNSNNENIHARNLDWWSDNNSLKEYTKIFDFKKDNKIIFSSVGWPGFIGVFSGMKPKKYAITLNAVLSQEPPEFAPPITFKVREILESKNSYSEVIISLANDPIASDCLLLVTGKEDCERAVIERTPKKGVLRMPDKLKNLVVTNGYIAMQNYTIKGDVLQESSCGRQNRALELLTKQKPESIADCFEILSDPDIKMNITMQQMVFNINQGTISLRI
jgi:hypothetical protein